MTSPQAAIEVNNLTKIYQAKGNGIPKYALNNLSLVIKPGSIFGLLGPNGAGKSTLINILAGTVTKTSGIAKIMGYDIDTEKRQAKLSIGIVPQEVVFDTFFPIYQALEFTAGYYRVQPVERRTNEILTALSLIDKKDSLPRALSGGMKRRFLIAKAMVHSPPILILDEPTAGVDIELRDQLWAYIRKLHAIGTTIVITTHYLAEAQNLCDEIAFINKGRIITQDNKDNLLNALGSKYIEVEFTSELSSDILNKILDDKKLIINYNKLADNKIRFYCNLESYNLHQLLDKIQSSKMEIKDLQIYQPDLETIFKDIIYKSNAEGG